MAQLPPGNWAAPSISPALSKRRNVLRDFPVAVTASANVSPGREGVNVETGAGSITR